MLAAAVPDGATALELGAGAGTASLCLAARRASMTITGIEIDRDLVELANDNAAANGMQDRVRFAAANAFALPLAFKRDYDCVLANPPFHGEGQASPDPDRARALMDGGTLADWLLAGLKRTISDGTFTAILRADRLNEALAALPLTGVSVLPLWPRAGEPAKRVLVQARKGSSAFSGFCRDLFCMTLQGLTPRRRTQYCGARRRLPWGYPVCRFRPIPEIADS